MGNLVTFLSSCRVSGDEKEVIRCLFFYGPTFDGDIPSKVGRDSLYTKKYIDRSFGYNWLTNEGIDFAINTLELDRAKDKWHNEKSRKS